MELNTLLKTLIDLNGGLRSFSHLCETTMVLKSDFDVTKETHESLGVLQHVLEEMRISDGLCQQIILQLSPVNTQLVGRIVPIEIDLDRRLSQPDLPTTGQTDRSLVDFNLKSVSDQFMHDYQNNIASETWQITERCKILSSATALLYHIRQILSSCPEAKYIETTQMLSTFVVSYAKDLETHQQDITSLCSVINTSSWVLGKTSVVFPTEA